MRLQQIRGISFTLTFLTVVPRYYEEKKKGGGGGQLSRAVRNMPVDGNGGRVPNDNYAKLLLLDISSELDAKSSVDVVLEAYGVNATRRAATLVSLRCAIIVRPARTTPWRHGPLRCNCGLCERPGKSLRSDRGSGDVLESFDAKVAFREP